jgi:ABC-type polysaccharide/polyol phosphate transport system ATPase subunit
MVTEETPMLAVEPIEPPAHSTEVVISVRHLSKLYRLYDHPQDRLKHSLLWRFGRQYGREFWALRDVSFELRRGERLGIIGRNGAGKSTLLQIVAGTLAPTEGDIRVTGRIAALLELGSGFNPEYTGRENVFMNGAILGLKQADMEQRFDEIANFAEIGDFMEQPIKLYSSGMVVRLAFAISTCIYPDVLILDEALAVGDTFFAQKCFRRLDELIQRGTAVILVTHDIASVGQFCNKVMVLHQGSQIYYGNPVDGIRKYFALQRTENLPFARSGTLTVSSPRQVIDQFKWPSPEAFLNLDHASIESTGQARLIGVALCNEQNAPCSLFEIGQSAVFYYEFALDDQINVPIGGITLVNEKNIFVHGKNSLQHQIEAPTKAGSDTTLRFRQSIKLDIAAGNYTFVIGLATLNALEYEHASQMPLETLSEKVVRVLSASRIGAFSVMLRTEGQALPHHGLADLPGDCQMVVIAPSG